MAKGQQWSQAALEVVAGAWKQAGRQYSVLSNLTFPEDDVTYSDLIFLFSLADTKV